MKLLSLASRATIVLGLAAGALGDDPFGCSVLNPLAFAPLTLDNYAAGGVLRLQVIPYGATATSLLVNTTGAARAAGVDRLDVLLGFDNTTWYCDYAQHPYFGATIGRYANRIANGSFSVDGVAYRTPLNEQWLCPNGQTGCGDTLHGGTVGFDRAVWSVASYDPSSHVTFTHSSPDGDMGFPGTLTLSVTHSILPNNTWMITYEATTDAPTVVGLTNHAYFSLHGFWPSQNVTDHVLFIDADTYVCVDAHLLPTGDICSVTTDWWMNFTVPKPIGRDITNGTVTPFGGYDNALLFNNASAQTRGVVRTASVYSPLSNISLTMYTDQPSVQFYSGNFLNGTIPRKQAQTFGPGPQYYQRWSALTLEAQGYIDAVNHPNFPSSVLQPGDTYTQTTLYTFAYV